MYYDIVESGKRIKEMRKKAGYSQKEFAELISITNQMLGKIERGESGTSIDTLGKIIESLNTTSDYILYGVEKNSIDFMGIKIPKDKIELIRRLIEAAVG